MIIGAPERIGVGGRVRMQAVLRWEQQEREELFWVDAERADVLTERAEGFLLAACALAALGGEQRVAAEGVSFDPSVRGQLALWNRCLREHYAAAGSPRMDVVFEDQATALPAEKRCFGFVSGGVDSLEMIHRNLSLYSPGHPWRLDSAVLIYGLYSFDCRAGEVVPERLEAWEDLRSRMQALMEGRGMELITLRTNLRSLAGPYECWTKVHMFYHLALGHFLAPHFQVGWAADARSSVPRAWWADGGLPQVGVNDLLSLRVASHVKGRLEKLRALTDWPEALQVCQPCHWVRLPAAGEVNCGECEKCVRTRLALLILGMPEAIAFSRPLTVDVIRSVSLGRNAEKVAAFMSLVRPLRQAGYPAFAAALRGRLRRWSRRRAWRRIFRKESVA